MADEKEREFDASFFDDGAAPAMVETASALSDGAGGVDARYFASYSNVAIHETMLLDEVRTGTYARAIGIGEAAPTANGFFAGKRVLDVGCGTGVLSMLAAKAGARRVVGVDACAGLVATARVAVAANGLGGIVRLVAGRVEDLTRADLGLDDSDKGDGGNCGSGGDSGDCGDDGFDIIISEWMGYCLLFESMLPSVLGARDRFMVKGAAKGASSAAIIGLFGGAGAADRGAVELGAAGAQVQGGGREAQGGGSQGGGTMWPSGCGMFLEAWSDRTPQDLGLTAATPLSTPSMRTMSTTPTDPTTPGSSGVGPGGHSGGDIRRRGGAWWRSVLGKPGAGRLAWWRNVHGLDLSAFSPALCRQASFEVVASHQVVSSRARLWDADLNTLSASAEMCAGDGAGGCVGGGRGGGAAEGGCASAGLRAGATGFESSFEVVVKGGAAMLDGFIVAFDVTFKQPASFSQPNSGVVPEKGGPTVGEGGEPPPTPVHVLSTGTDGPATHWKQTLFLLDPLQAPPAPLPEGTTVCGTFAMRRNEGNPRAYTAALTWDVGDLSGSQTYAVST